MARSVGVSPRKMLKSAERLLLTASTVTPNFRSMASPASSNMPNTPIEPVSVSRSATMASAGAEM